MPIVVCPSKLYGRAIGENRPDHRVARLKRVFRLCKDYGTTPASLGDGCVEKPIEYNRPLWPTGGPLYDTDLFFVCLTCKEGITGVAKWAWHRKLKGNNWWTITYADAIKWIRAPQMWMHEHPELYNQIYLRK
jgi:hypothetical protein